VPTAHRELARLTSKEHTNVHRALQLRPETVLKLLEECDAFRRPGRFSQMLLACQCDAQGRTGLEEKPYPQRLFLEQALAIASSVQLTGQEMAERTGPAIASRLRERRLETIKAIERPPA
jgi:tRNA nucleotidyltransferase (CCA-adding enzyme)